MANDSGGSSPKIPASGWVLVLFALGAFWAKDIPLQGSRPSDPSSRTDKYQELQDVDARLWQDPLAVVERADGADSAKAASATRADIHSRCGIRKELAKVATNEKIVNELTILAVMVPGGPYAESAEARRRTRYAVVSGLRAKEYVPQSADRLGYVRIDSVSETDPESAICYPEVIATLAGGLVGPTPLSEDYFTVPFERFNSRTPELAGKVLLLWLNSEKFEKTPISNIASLIHQIIPPTFDECGGEVSNPGAKTCVRLRILGPRGSGSFRELLEELIKHKSNNWQDFKNEHTHVLGALRPKPYFYSYSATLADERLFAILNPPKSANSQTLVLGETARSEWVSDFLSSDDVKDNVQVLRTISQDDKLAAALVDELDLRGIKIDPTRLAEAHSTGIALVSEWDTLFGRVLPSSICAALMRRHGEAHAKMLAKNCSSVRPPEGISYFSYLRGLDGKIAQEGGGESRDSTKKPSAKSDKDSSRVESAQIEQADGQGQFDYLRRMAAAMKRNDKMLRATTGRGYRAIGVVGSDVYDKLIVLQALRAQFPEAIFFTTDLDARLLHPSENKWARNLIVASAFGLELDENEQRFIPPFRDSYQTSAFLATKIALTMKSAPRGNDIAFNVSYDAMTTQLGTPRIFEVSSRSFVDLSPPVSRELCKGETETCLHPTASTFNPPNSQSMRMSIALLSIVLLCAAAVVLLSRRLRGRMARGTTGLVAILTCWRTERTRRYLRTYHRVTRALARRRVRGALIVALAVTALLGILFGPSMLTALFGLLTEHGRGEPFSWFDGVSIWPTELMRLLALFLALYFIARGWSKLEDNRRAIMRHFELKRTERAIERDLAHRPFSLMSADTVAKPSYRALRRWWRFKRYVATAFSSPRYHPRPEKNDESGMRGRLQPDAIAFWRKYVYLNRWHVRALRIGVLFCVLFLFNYIVIQLFGRPVAPVRGHLGAFLDQVIIMSTVIAFQLLTIAALDATVLCYRLITELRDQRTVWPQDARERMARKLRLKLSGPFGDAAARVIDEWLDIQIVAKRSEAVVRLIYYPMIVLSLMILARNSAFDNWVLTPALLCIYGINASIVVVAAFLLRRAAENSRRNSLQVIRDSLSHYRMGGDRGKPLAEHIESLAQQIEALQNGAFARFSQQPLVRSILLVVGSVGGTSLLELTALLNF